MNYISVNYTAEDNHRVQQSLVDNKALNPTIW